MFKVLDTDSGKVVEMGEREFVIGTVASEMPPTYHSEALKAQAVASFTYYSAKRKAARANPDPDLKGADFSDVPTSFPEGYSQEGMKAKWGANYDAYYKKVKAAVDAVFGKRICLGGEPILAAYHAISFGTTEDAKVVWDTEYPYLKPVPSPGDKLSPDYQAEATFTPAQFSEAMAKEVEGLKLEGDAAGWIGKEVSTSSSGSVTKITVGGKDLSGRMVREALSLRSACFTVEYTGGKFCFTVLGYGHGVGMSQYGADYLARQGSGWQEILQTYYTGVTIQ